jgi:GNAT superfamily N-acetyltransferase
MREIGEDEVGRLVAVRNEVWPRGRESVAGLVDWRAQAEDTVWLLASEGDADLACGVGIHGWHSPPGVGRVAVHVVAAARGRGTGSALLGRLGAWLQERGCSEASASVEEDDGASRAWAERRGFVEVGRSSVLALDLAAVAPAAIDPPDGVEIVSWAERPELARGLYRVYAESAPDVPGEEDVEPPPFDEWLASDMQGLHDRPDATFVALAGDEVVGYAKLSLLPEEPEVAWHDLTGVLRAWRGRGVAGALKRAQIVWAAEQGFRTLKTFNEERNEPVRRLNERHGYRLEPGLVTMRGPVSLGRVRR